MFRGQIPFVPQMEASECGAACLSMVLGHFGHHAPLVDVRAQCGVSRDGTSAAALLRGAKAFGLEGRVVRVEPEQLRVGALPAILHWKFNHFVVATRVTKTGLLLLDPACGARHVGWAEIDRSFTGICLRFVPGPLFRRLPPRSLSTSRYWQVLRRSLGAMGLVALSALLLELVGLLFPVLSQVAIDFVIRPRQARFLPLLALLLVGAAVLRGFLTLARQRVMAGLRLSLTWTLQTDFVAHLVRLPLGFFTQRASGDIAGRAAAHDQVRELLQSLSTALLDAGLVVSYLLLMLAYDPWLGSAVLLLTAARIMLVVSLQRFVRYATAGEVVAGAGELAAVDETFSTVEVVRSLGIEATAERRYGNLLVDRLNAAASRRRTELSFLQFAPLLEAGNLALIYFLGGRRVAADQMTLGVLAAFVAMTALCGRPLGALVESVSRIPALRESMRRIDDVWAAAPERDGGLDPGRLQGLVSLHDVSFAYGGSAAAVSNVSLQIAPGECVAIVGESGSGKSSLASLVAGLERPSAGVVALDGRDVAFLDATRVHEQIGVVFADSLFFSASVRENLTLGAAADPQRLQQVLELACLHDELGVLPDGYDTVLEGGGSPLSGGQRQRLALARALLGAPRVLILDEATSSVDVELEGRILAQLRQLGMTRIVISHRPSAIRSADRILVMDQGRLVDQGAYDELLFRCAAFRRAIHAQSELSV
jgi:ATP-binding cassette subfamily B protein